MTVPGEVAFSREVDDTLLSSKPIEAVSGIISITISDPRAGTVIGQQLTAGVLWSLLLLWEGRRRLTTNSSSMIDLIRVNIMTSFFTGPLHGIRS